ncbi:MAG: hypothetical protein ABJC74_03230, partial [Gemmatimonadota bacterium]
AQLLTSLSAGTATGPSLNRASLPVLRAYLDGLTKLRQGLPTSVAAFGEALDRDTTFAPSALGLVQAIGWFGDGSTAARPLRIAWNNRQQLSQKDQALLAVSAGPRYPAQSSTREMFEAAQRYLQLAPERADAWYSYGDKIYHFGDALGIPDRGAKAAEAFKRALATDSSYVPGYIHLQQLAVELGDSGLDRRLDQLRSTIDTGGFWVAQQQWYRAVARRDTAELTALMHSPAIAQGLLFTMARMPLFVPDASPEPALRAYDSLIARFNNAGALQANRGAASALLLAAGRPAAALAMLNQIPSIGHSYVLGRRVLDGLLGSGDTVDAVRAAAEFTPSAMAPLAHDSSGRADQAVAIRALLAWRLMRGDTTAATGLITKLRAGRASLPPQATPSIDDISIATFETLLAERRGRGEAADEAARLDSMLAGFDYSNGSVSRLELATLVAARLVEKYQTPAAALATVRRRASWWNNETPYLGLQLREEGRLAALAGQKDEAILSYRHYLSLQDHPEPALVAEVTRVRQELARLE